MQYTVYAQTDARGRIVAVNSSAFLPTPVPNGWVRIDEGAGDRYHHAQGHYFGAPLHDERGVCRYAHVPDAEDGAQKWRERTQAEMDADYTPPVPTPTLNERVAAVEAGQADQTGTLNDLVLYLAGEIGGFGAERGPSGALPEGQSNAQNATETSESPAGRAATIEGGETQ